MQSYNVRRLRDGSYPVYVYNSGPTMFLYDDANSETIRRAAPSLASGFYCDPEKDIDAPLRALGENRLLVVFELYQDDEFVGEVSLGPPLTRQERGGVDWSEPARSILSLPSGALCIESLDCLRIGDETPDEAGGRLNIAPGDYVVSLQCLAKDYEQDTSDLIPEYFISLEPFDATRGDFGNRPFLPYPRR